MASKPKIDEVQRILRPYERDINRYLLEAWDRWWNNPDRLQLHYRRSQACIVHNHSMNAAIAGFRGRKGVHVMEKPGYETAFFMVSQRLLFRIKKGDEKGYTSNVRTQASLAFVDPTENLSLFTDLPDVWRVDVAYVLNYLRTKIDQIVVVAREDYKILWSYPIYGSAAEGDVPAPVTQLPIGPNVPPPAESGLRIPGADRDKKKNKRDGEK